MEKTKKILKQSKEAIERSTKPNNGAISLGFNNDVAYVNGIAQNPIKPQFAMIRSNINDKENFQCWTPFTKNQNDLSILAVDFSKPSGIPVLYYQFEENSELQYLKFDAKSSLKENEFIFFYAELGYFSFFYSIFKDPETGTNVIEFQSNNKLSSKLFYRQMLRTFINSAQFEEIKSALLILDKSIVKVEGEVYGQIKA